MSLFMPLCLVTLAVAPIVHGYSKGAPSTQCGAAADMKPDHGSTYTQPAATNPYTLYTVSGQTTYKTTEIITLTLSGGGTAFKGFLVQVMSSDGAIVGQMSATSGNKLVVCGGGGSGITHSDKTRKTTIDFRWQADETTSNGAMTFLVTIVQDYTTYWAKQAMLTLTKDTTDMSTLGFQVTGTPLSQTTAVSSTDGTTLTTQPSYQVTTNNSFVFTTANITETDINVLVTTADIGTADYITTTANLDLNNNRTHPYVSAGKYNASVYDTSTAVSTGKMIAAVYNTHTDIVASNENATVYNISTDVNANKDTATVYNTQTDFKFSKNNATVYNTSTDVVASKDIAEVYNTITDVNASKDNATVYNTATDARSSKDNITVYNIPTNVNANKNGAVVAHMFNTISNEYASKYLTNTDSSANEHQKHRINLFGFRANSSDYQTLAISSGVNSSLYQTLFGVNTSKYNTLTTSTDYRKKADLIHNTMNINANNHHIANISRKMDVSAFSEDAGNGLNYVSNNTDVHVPTNEPVTAALDKSFHRKHLHGLEETTLSNLTYQYEIENNLTDFGNANFFYSNLEAVEEHRKNITFGMIKKTIKLHEDSLTVTEIPLSDPDRIFEAVKEILKKDKTQFIQFTDISETLENAMTDTNDTIENANTTGIIIESDIEKDAKKEEGNPTFITEIKFDLTTVSNYVISSTGTHSSKMTTGLSISDNAEHIGNSSDATERSVGNEYLTSSPQLDLSASPSSTRITTVSVQENSSLEMNDTVNKWMREHVHTIPKPVLPDFVKIRGGNKATRPSTVVEHSVLNFPEGGQIRYDPQCGSTKGCFVDCSGNDCKFMVTWRDMGTSVQFELYGKPDRSFTDAWVAVGFSSDTRMGDDSVTECVFSNGIIQAFNSFNTGYSNRRLNTAQYGLDSVYGSYMDGVLFCTFVRQKSVPQVQEIFDLEQDWHIMFANGKVLQVPAWQLYMHSVSDLPPASAASVDYQSVTVIGSAAKFPLAKAHGCLMIFAWVLFCGIGIMVARYYKSVWSDKTFLKLKIWFQVHRACMVTALALDVLACILILIEVKGYSSIPDIPGKGYLRSHPVLGIIVTILCLANPVMAFFRPGGDHDKRPIFNWAHWGVGMTAYILSAICICFGFQLGKASTPDYAIYIMIVYVFYIIAFDVVFEITECISKKEQKVKVEGMEMSTRNGTDNGTIPNGNHVTKDKLRHSDKIKTILLVFHIAFTGAFAIVLVLVVALN